MPPRTELERLAAAHLEAPGVVPTAPGAAAAFTWGPLEVYERLGEGTFGEVFRAHEPAPGREVALKLRRSDAAGPAGAWLAEARRLARVSHPNVLAVLGVAEHDGRAGLWTELVHGETLEARLAREGPLPAREVAAVGADLCRALAAVHAQGLVHGDVKTTNVMCERGTDAKRPGRLVLMDFGAGQEGPPASPFTWTPLASAPEVLRGDEAGPATDQYALGVLLYRLLTARDPQADDTLIERARRSPPPPLRDRRPDTPPVLHAAVLRALASDPAARHPNLAAFEHALTTPLDDDPDDMWRPFAAATVVMVLVVGAVLMWPQHRVPAAPPAADAPAAPRPLAVSASLLRRTRTGREPLVDGGVVRAGDRVSLELRSGEPVWAYVLEEHAPGGASALFPQAGLETANPLPSGAVHRLPGKLHGREFAWRVGQGGGSETFVVVASRRARPEIEALVRALAPAHAEQPTAPRRGVEGLFEEPRAPAADGPVTRLADQLTRARDPSLWLWHVRARRVQP